MKKGINVWSFPAGMSAEGSVRLAAKTGYDSIELSLDAEGPLSLKSSDEEIARFRTLADELGIEISSLASGLLGYAPGARDDPAVREQAKATVRFQLHAARVLGCGAMLRVVPGCVGADFVPDCPVVPYDVAYDRALEACKELAKDAEEAGVVIALENVWNKFLLSPAGASRDFIDKIGSDYVKVYFDIGNVLVTGYPEHWVKILGERVASSTSRTSARSWATSTASSTCWAATQFPGRHEGAARLRLRRLSDRRDERLPLRDRRCGRAHAGRAWAHRRMLKAESRPGAET